MTNGFNIINSTSGDDVLYGTENNDFIPGQAGNDIIGGQAGDDILSGDVGIDTLTGGGGKDEFRFSDDPFSGGAPTQSGGFVLGRPQGQGIQFLNKPDNITDFQITEDRLIFSKDQLGIDRFNFVASSINDFDSGEDKNLIVLTDRFNSAADAAGGLANNASVTGDEGLFVYFNQNLGFARVVYSEDLGDGGPISVLANLTNVTNSNDLANLDLPNFGLV
jgi:serralysin